MASLRQEIRDGVAYLTLDRPDKRNAFDDALIAALSAALGELADMPVVRAVVLAGDGPSFSAGADLAWMGRMATYGDEANLADARRLADMLHGLDTLPKPTIARVHGAAFGGAVGLVACCDISIAAEDAKFCLSEVRLGINPSVISPYVIAAIGARAARRYFVTAEVMDARRAHELGLVHDVVPAEMLDRRIEDVLRAIARGGPNAQREAKDLIHAVAGRPVDVGLREETARRIARLRASDEGRAGIDAFLKKDEPPWA